MLSVGIVGFSHGCAPLVAKFKRPAALVGREAPLIISGHGPTAATCGQMVSVQGEVLSLNLPPIQRDGHKSSPIKAEWT